MGKINPWDRIFAQHGRQYFGYRKPHEAMKKVAADFKKKKVKRVLDLGCGTGRHTVLLAQQSL